MYIIFERTVHTSLVINRKHGFIDGEQQFQRYEGENGRERVGVSVSSFYDTYWQFQCEATVQANGSFRQLLNVTFFFLIEKGWFNYFFVVFC